MGVLKHLNNLLTREEFVEVVSNVNKRVKVANEHLIRLFTRNKVSEESNMKSSPAKNTQFKISIERLLSIILKLELTSY